MCVCARVSVNVLALLFFSAIGGNIPQMTVSHIEVVGEGKCGATESFFPEHRVLCNMNHSQNSTRMSQKKPQVAS